MPNTVTFNISSNAQPGMAVNHMVYALYKQSDPGVIVYSQAFAPPHNARLVSFPGIERTNWQFKLLQTLPDNVTVVSQMDSYFFVPGDNFVTYYEPVEIEIGVTPGTTIGANTFTFDGSGGTFDWRGRKVFVERVGQGTMSRTTSVLQYSWDSVNGIFTLLAVGDEFAPNELFNVEFGLVTDAISGVPVANLFSGTMIITGATTLVAGDAGKNIIIKGASVGFDITLPDITLVPSSVPFYFESGISSHKCVRIKTVMGQTIDWLKGAITDLKIGVCEALVIYKEPSTTNWRVHRADGNFMQVGRIIVTDADISVQEFNVMELNGATYSITGAGRRLYEEFVQKLPPSQVCTFAAWGTGDNKYKYSYASGDNAKLPDRRNLYVRNSDGSILPGVYQKDAVYIDPAKNLFATSKNGVETATGWDSSPGEINIRQGFTIQSEAGVTETRPKTVVVRMFVLV